jgi:hypothetical protein
MRRRDGKGGMTSGKRKETGGEEVKGRKGSKIMEKKGYT